MNLPNWKLTVSALVLAGAAGATSSPPAALGSESEYKFHDAPLNSLGVKSLAELRGKPVVIDFWGRN